MLYEKVGHVKSVNFLIISSKISVVKLNLNRNKITFIFKF